MYTQDKIISQIRRTNQLLTGILIATSITCGITVVWYFG